MDVALDTSLNFHHLRYFWVVAREGSVTAAAAKLRVTQPTVSEQLSDLEATLGERLFRREGKRLVLTEVGRTVLRFAEEIFALGTDLVDTVRGRATSRPARLVVGLSDGMPKSVAYRILEPALGYRIVVLEDDPPKLLDQLAAHTLDVVLTEELPSRSAEVFPHLLGECGVGIFGTAKLARKVRQGWPGSLEGAPLLLPAPGSLSRRDIDQWLEARKLAPKVVGEIEDPALVTVFAQEGAGLFAAPDAIAIDGLVRAGTLTGLRARFYAVTVSRKIVHPAVQLIAGTARSILRGRSP
jgi:LysR family transcriptional regulator, transcriptional activator of nhaA